ncbi:hypothetical protein J6590_102994 [Homalodisca vitripennis]|nr:hypothetical protein J6590_102994 [Homalodisca vitripennis]
MADFNMAAANDKAPKFASPYTGTAHYRSLAFPVAIAVAITPKTHVTNYRQPTVDTVMILFAVRNL